MALKVLLTGATGSVGSGVLSALLSHGHHVTALVRTQANGEDLVARLGSKCSFHVLELSTSTGPELQCLACDFDCFISAALTSNEVEAVSSRAFLAAGRDRAAVGKSSHFVYTSGCTIFGDCGEAMIWDNHSTANCLMQFSQHRLVLEPEVLGSSSDLFRTALVRPGWVYPCYYIEQYLRNCKALGQLVVPDKDAYISLIHKDDLGDLYVRILEARAVGAFNAAEDEDIKTQEWARLASRVLGLQTSVITETAPRYSDVGYFLIALELSQRMRTRATEQLGWRPRSMARDYQAFFLQ